MSKPFYWGFHDQFTQQQVESLLLGDGVTAVRSAYCILSGSQNDTITGLIDSDWFCDQCISCHTVVLLIYQLKMYMCSTGSSVNCVFKSRKSTAISSFFPTGRGRMFDYLTDAVGDMNMLWISTICSWPWHNSGKTYLKYWWCIKKISVVQKVTHCTG